MRSYVALGSLPVSNVITRVSGAILLNISRITMPVIWKLVDKTNLFPNVLLAHKITSSADLPSRSLAISVASDGEKVTFCDSDCFVLGFVNLNFLTKLKNHICALLDGCVKTKCR